MEIQTKSSQNLVYHHFHIDFQINLQHRIVSISNIGPNHTQKYPQAIIIGGMATVARIMQSAMRGVASWDFYFTDLDQVDEITLSPKELPHACFEFIEKTNIPAPPPKHMDIKISTYWSLLPCHGGNVWLHLANKPAYSNICKIITLKVPSNLRRNQTYHVNLQVQSKHES